MKTLLKLLKYTAYSIAGIFVLFWVGIILAAGNAAGDGLEAKRAAEEEKINNSPAAYINGAVMLCKYYIEQSVANPDRLEFRAAYAVNTKEKEYQAFVDVVGENGFGALVGATYTCTLENLGEPRLFNLVNIEQK